MGARAGKSLILLLLPGFLLSCVRVNPPRLSPAEQGKLLARLDSKHPFSRSTAGCLLVMSDPVKYTPVIGEHLRDEPNCVVIVGLIRCLGDWGTRDAIPYLEPFLADHRQVITRVEFVDQTTSVTQTTTTISEVAAQAIRELRR